MPGQGAGTGLSAGFVEVRTSTDSRGEAMELAAEAVAARLAACGQVAGPVTSTFWWDGAIEREEEWLVIFKLPADRYRELEEFIAGRHSYEEPEIVAVPIVAGSAGYLGWLTEETTPR